MTVLRCFLLTALIAFALAAVPARAAEPVTVRVAMTTFTSLDPVSLPRADRSARDVAENLFVGLTRDAGGGAIRPMLARDWTISADGLTWTFNLRTDISWVRADLQTQQVERVRPVVAGDFVYALRRACDPQPPNPEAHTIDVIAGCRKVATTNPDLVNEPYIAREVGVTAPNDQTLEIKLAFPASYFPAIVALPEFRPVPKESIASGADWTQPGTIMTDGPWVLTDWTRGQPMTLVRNPLWPDKPEGKIERVAITFVDSASAALQQFKSGNVDFARLDTASALSLGQTTPDVVILKGLAESVTVLGFSAERSAVANVAFRRALSLAIDRDKLAEQFWHGLAEPVAQMVPPAPSALMPNEGFAPDAAKAALIASGLPTCKPAERLQLAVDDQPQSAAIAQALLDQWQAALGCSPAVFKITPMPVSAVQAIAHGTVNADAAPRSHLWIATFSPDYDAANAWLDDGLHCRYGFFRTGVPCGDADKLLDSAASETDSANALIDLNQAELAWFGPSGTFPVAPLVAMRPAAVGVNGHIDAGVSGSAWFDSWLLYP